MLQYYMSFFRFFVWFILLIGMTGCFSSSVDISETSTPNRTPTKVYQLTTPVITTVYPTLTQTPSPSPTVTLVPTYMSTPSPVRIAAVGDISICGQEGIELTAALLPENLDAVLILGDPNNEDGYLWQYEKCFDPAWGKYKNKIYPAPGNHDYYSDPLQGYYVYFGQRAGEVGKGYYSFSLGDWLIISLNTNCGAVPCGPTSEQAVWLQEVLAESQSACTLAFWHHPRWSSGLAGETYWISTFWDLLYEADADIVLSGHDHHYERVQPLNQKGEVDEVSGMRSFIVGTGGASSRGLAEIKSYSEKQIVGQFGVLFLNLYKTEYEWQFVNIEGDVMDEGRSKCH
ncbi:MAG: alkaline phosphatase [Anaerolineaceae bacterium]|nr:alkaline phosphatase [Anaerolineaceae bacterium]